MRREELGAGVRADTHVMVLPDGRDLAWMELGAPNGVPVFAFHGTPGSRLQLALADTPAREAGVRLVLPDRPGYGLSAYQRRRRMTGWPDDVRHLADHLGLSRFAVVGISGGGPHAAVCARFLPERVSAAGIISGVGPLSEPGSEAGMMRYDRALVRLARRSPFLLLPLFWAIAAVGRLWPEGLLETIQHAVAGRDAALLARSEVRAAFHADLRRAARTAGEAAAQDYALFARDWGFRCEDIAVPVHLWHGDDDRAVPIGQARNLARLIPGSVLHECPGEGHLLVVDRLAEILQVVITT